MKKIFKKINTLKKNLNVINAQFLKNHKLQITKKPILKKN